MDGWIHRMDGWMDGWIHRMEGYTHSAIDEGLTASSTLFNLKFGPSGSDRLGHSAHLLHLFDYALGFVVHLIGERLHHEGSRPGIDDFGYGRFFLQNDLRVASDARGEQRRKRQRLVERVGVQRLGAAKHGRHGLHSRPDDVVVGILRRQRPSRRLAMRPQHQRLGALRIKLLLEHVSPETTRRSQFGDFLSFQHIKTRINCHECAFRTPNHQLTM